MVNTRLYLSPPYLDEADNQLLMETMSSGWAAPAGPQLELFQERLEDFFPGKKVLCLNSGTSALHLAVKLLGLKKGESVIIGSFTFIAAANAVLYEGGIPVFIDSEPESWNLDPQRLADYLSQVKTRPRAVIVTHIFGRPAKIDQIREVCVSHGVKLIEDAAEALGTTHSGQQVGGPGDLGVLSFNGNKIITTSAGGALICSQGEYDKARFWANQSKDPAPYYSHSEVGYNYALSNVLAGLGLSQLSKLDFFLKRKQEISGYYEELLSPLGLFEFLHGKEGRSNNWLTTPLIKRELIGMLTPAYLIESLEQENIESRHFWKPLHLQPLFETSEKIGGAVCEDLFNRGICLPSGVGMSKGDQERVVEVVAIAVKKHQLS